MTDPEPDEAFTRFLSTANAVDAVREIWLVRHSPNPDLKPINTMKGNN